MNQFNFDWFFDRIGYYQILVACFAVAGIAGYFLISKEQRKKEALKLSLWIIGTVAFYEIFATMVGSQKIVNSWVYNLFNSHLTVIFYFLLLKSFLKRKSHKKTVNVMIVLFLLTSLILHLSGVVHYNDGGEYISFLNTVLMLCCCGLYFFELITLDEFLESSPLKEFSFWAATAILFYFSSSFMIYISYQYLYTNHLDIFYMVIKIPIHMTLLCNFLLLFGIFSEVIKERFHIETIHV